MGREPANREIGVPGDTMHTIDRTALERLLNEEVLHLAPEPHLGGGHSQIFACRTSNGDYILRVCQGQQGYYTHYFPHLLHGDDWLDQRWATDAARAAGIPAPQIIRTDRERRWVVMTRLPGLPIDSEYEHWMRCPYDEAHFGDLLQRMHDIVPAGWGPIDDAGHALFATWPDFLLAAARSALATCGARAALAPALHSRLEACWLPALAALHLERPALLHMESLGFANILYQPETRTISGLLDYEDCLGGDPRFEFTWMRFYFERDGPEQYAFDFTRFAQGYGAIDWEDPVYQLYRPFTYLDKLRWVPIPGERATRYCEILEAMAEAW